MRLKQVRKSHGFTQAQVAGFLGIPLRTYQNYEREVNDPDSAILCELADLYHVTLDYLFGLSDIPNYPETAPIELTKQERVLLNLFHQMTDEDKETFIRSAKVYAYAGEAKKEESTKLAGVVE